MFSTKAKKLERDYQNLSQAMQDAGFDSPQKIEEHSRLIFQRSVRFSIFLFLIGGILMMLFPQYNVFWGVAAALLFAWMWKATLSGRKLLQRYIDEELSNKTVESENTSEKTEMGQSKDSEKLN